MLFQCCYDTTYYALKTDPQFKGGGPALDEYLSKKSRYPLVPVTEALIKGGFVKYAVVNFTVNAEGKISDVIVTRSISDFTLPRNAGAPFDREAVRLVSTMPAWEPGKQDGENVVSEQWLIIGFK
jgi:protein TonB